MYFSKYLQALLFVPECSQGGQARGDQAFFLLPTLPKRVLWDSQKGTAQAWILLVSLTSSHLKPELCCWHFLPSQMHSSLSVRWGIRHVRQRVWPRVHFLRNSWSNSRLQILNVGNHDDPKNDCSKDFEFGVCQFRTKLSSVHECGCGKRLMKS